MWAFVWLLQGLVASAAGVYLNTPCIRSLLRCAPFQLSLSDGKYSNTFIEDVTTLNRRCRSLSPLLECTQEAVLKQCGLDITPAERDFVKTRLFIAEICKDVAYTQKVYLRYAGCINRERDWVIQACNPQDYVQLVNTSNLISLEGSCIFQKMLINCRRDAILEKCGTDAADLYQRVKAVDMNLDFLCLDGRDLRSPKFLLDVVINSYISLLLETLRPILVMESFYLKDIAQVSQEETTLTSPTKVRVPPLERAKMPARNVKDVVESKWRRFGDIPMETIIESSLDDESSIDSVDGYIPHPSVATDPVTTDPAEDLEAVVMDTDNVDSTLDVQDPSSDSDGIIQKTGLYLDGLSNTQSSDFEEEASSDPSKQPNSAGSEFGQSRFSTESSSTKNILGIPIPQFDHTEVDTTIDTNDVSDVTDSGTIQGTTMLDSSDLETTTDFDEFQGMATGCPEYLETTVTDYVDDALETTSQYPGDHEISADSGIVLNAASHSGVREESSANLDDAQDTKTLHGLETTTDLDSLLRQSTTFRFPSDDFKDAATESGALLEKTRPELDKNEEHVFDTSLPPEKTRAKFGGDEPESSSPQSIISHLKRVEDFVSNTEYDYARLGEFFEDLQKISISEDFASQEYVKNKMAMDLAWVFYFFSKNSDPRVEVPFEKVSDAFKILKVIGTDGFSGVGHTSNDKDHESSTTGNESVENSEGRERIEGNFEEELDGYVTSTVVSRVIDLLGKTFAPKEIKRRSVGLGPFIKSMSPEEVEELIHKNLPGGEYVKELVQSWDQAVDAERLKSSTGNKEDVETPEEPVTALKTIKSIAELGVKLNYVLIGESYVPLEVGYVEGNEDRKSNRNLKIPRRKFKFYTSTPTEPSTEIPDDLGFSTTEYLTETGTEQPESDSTGRFPSDFSCPEVTGNQTPRISHLVDPEIRSGMESCFGVLREEIQLAGESPVDELSNDNPGETDQEFRRSGDIEELPGKVDPRNLDMETMVALKFYGEVLTELASMLPSDSPDPETLAMRALLDGLGDPLKTKMDRSEIPRMDEFGRRFQKRSLSESSECADQVKPDECEMSKTDDRPIYDVGYSPKSYIPFETSYPTANGEEDAYDVPVAKYILMGETRLPLELHFTHKNLNYVHYGQINFPKRYVNFKDTIVQDEGL